MNSTNDFNEALKNMRKRTTKLEHEGDYWSEDEKKSLKQKFDDGMGISEIALFLQRTEPAVIQQIEKMDLYGRKANPVRRKYAKEISSPCYLCTAPCEDREKCPYAKLAEG